MSEQWTGASDAGTAEYSRAQRKRVVAYLLAQHVGRMNAAPAKHIALACAVEGRMLRSICSDCDGVEFVLGYAAEEGIFVCAYRGEADDFTHRLAAQSFQMQDRARRRDKFAASLPVGDGDQGRLL